MDEQDIRTFKDPTGLTRWTKRFLYVQIAIAIVALYSGILEYQLLDDIENESYTSESQVMAAADSNDMRQGIVGIVQLVIFVVTAVLVLKWIYRANFNAHQLGASGMRFTPGWSIGWYFIPIAHFWTPFQAMQEIWMTSKDPDDWETQSLSPLLSWWWFFWIVSMLLQNLIFRISMKAEELDELMEVNTLTLASDFLEIPLCLIFIAIVNGIYKAQMAQGKSEDGPLPVDVESWPLA